VIDGEQGGISKAVNWQGGGSFRFMQLGAPVFDETGAIHPEVRFNTLAAFIWMQETRTPWRTSAEPVRPERSEGSNGPHVHGSTSSPRTGDKGTVRTECASPYLGTHNGVAYYLLFNGILGDRRPQGGNVLTRAVLDWLTVNFSHAGPRVIYGESVRVGQDRLSADNVVFRSIPHEVEAR
jgi:adenine-specific DNA-methyltransferase